MTSSNRRCGSSSLQALTFIPRKLRGLSVEEKLQILIVDLASFVPASSRSKTILRRWATACRRRAGQKKKEAKGFKKIRPDCQAVDSDLGDYTQWVRLRAPTRKKEPTS